MPTKAKSLNSVLQGRLLAAIAKRKSETPPYTCVIERGGEFITSRDLGIKPLMASLRLDKNAFSGAVVCDKIIGKAAALMLILGGADAVQGEIMSEGAIETLTAASIPFLFERKVGFIQNRDKTDLCPMEKTVLEIESPQAAFEALEKTIAILMNPTQ